MHTHILYTHKHKQEQKLVLKHIVLPCNYSKNPVDGDVEINILQCGPLWMGLINFNWLLGSINRVESVCYTMYYVGCIRGYLNLYHTKTYITYHIVIMIFIILFVIVLYYGIGRSFFIIIFIIEFYHLSEFEATNSSWDEPWSLSQSLSCFPIMIVGRCSKLCRVNTALLTKGSARPCSVGEWEVAWVKVQDSGNMLGLWAVWLLANECIGYFCKANMPKLQVAMQLLCWR